MTPALIKWLGNVTLLILICYEPQVDYTRFSHVTEKHRAACSSCHTFPSKNWKQVRKGDDAFPDVTEYPEHPACLNCHRQQFFARERPAPRICSNCHVKATPNDTSRHPFPRGGLVSDFRVLFPKDKHADVTFDKRPAHPECFTCHNQEAELAPLPPNCDSCHKPKS
jgi:hypothetical protein